jgi:hypothetical protein
MKKISRSNKMTVTRETLRPLDSKVLGRVDGGKPPPTRFEPCITLPPD